MNEEYLTYGIAALLHSIIIGYFFYQNYLMKKADVEIAESSWDKYLHMRNDALSTRPEKLGIELTSDTEKAFAIAIEEHLGTQLYFLIIFKNGQVEAFNSGKARQDIFQYPKDESIAESVAAAFECAQYNFARMKRRLKKVLEPGNAMFYIITNQDTYSSNSSFQEIFSENFVWEELLTRIDGIIECIQNLQSSRKVPTVYWKRRKSANKNYH